jgi:hypothetical protein
MTGAKAFVRFVLGVRARGKSRDNIGLRGCSSDWVHEVSL